MIYNTIKEYLEEKYKWMLLPLSVVKGEIVGGYVEPPKYEVPIKANPDGTKICSGCKPFKKSR